MLKSEVVDRVCELVSDKSAEMRLLVSNWVNIVLSDIASRGLLSSFKQLDPVTLVATQADYTLPSTTDQVSKVYVPAWGDPEGILTKVNDEEYLRQQFAYGFDALARPRVYNIFGRFLLRLYPTPNLANAPVSPTTLEKLYVLKYRDAASVPDSAEITEIKLKHIPILIQGAYSMGAKFDSVLDSAQATLLYEKGINRLIGDANRDLDRASQVPYQDL